MGLFKEVKYTICLGKNDTECEMFVNKDKQSKDRRNCKRCAGEVERIYSVNQTAVFVALALSSFACVGLISWAYSSFFNRSLVSQPSPTTSSISTPTAFSSTSTTPSPSASATFTTPPVSESPKLKTFEISINTEQITHIKSAKQALSQMRQTERIYLGLGKDSPLKLESLAISSDLQNFNNQEWEIISLSSANAPQRPLAVSSLVKSLSKYEKEGKYTDQNSALVDITVRMRSNNETKEIKGIPEILLIMEITNNILGNNYMLEGL